MSRLSRPVRTAALSALAVFSGGLAALGPTAAWAAAPAPYSDWLFDFKRAGDSAERAAELARTSPAFARIWFYGQLLDLVTVGVSEEIRAGLRPRLTALAKALAALSPPDTLPTLLLDRAQGGALTGFAQRARDVEDRLVGAGRAGEPEAASVAAATDPDVALPVFYRLLSRAEATRGHMGGEREAAIILDVARRIAESLALAVDDLSAWEALARWQGGAGVTVDKALVVDSTTASALNAALAGDLPLARKRMGEALTTAQAAHGGSFHTALVLNGTANLAARAGDPGAARQIRHQVMTQVRPLNQKSLVALLAHQLVLTYLVERNLSETILYTRELRALGDALLTTPDYMNTLLRAAEALSAGGATDLAAGRLAPAAADLEEAAHLYTLLKTKPAIEATEPSDRVETARLARERAHADVTRTLGLLARRRGRGPEAEGLLEAARAIDTAIGALDGVAELALDQSVAALEAGDFDTALARVGESLDTLATAGGPPEATARALRQRGLIRLRRGEPAAALENANAGLSVLRAAGEPAQFAVERGALHRLAAAALDSGGLTLAARERIGFARGVAVLPETVLQAALLAFEAGDVAGVDAAFEGVPDAVIDARIKAVYRGCAQVQAGAAEAAVATLAQVSTLVSPAHRPYQVGGRTCLAAAHLALGHGQEASNAVVPARALATEYGDPALQWRVAALEGETAMALGKPADAATGFRQALDRFAEAGLERPSRGRTLDLRLPALPLRPERALTAAPDALAAAGGAKAEEVDLNRSASLAYALYAQLVEASPPPQTDAQSALKDRRPAEELTVRAARTALARWQAAMRDPALEGADRATVVSGLNAGLKRLRDALTAARAAAPTAFGWLEPGPTPGAAFAPPVGEARVFYRTGETAGRVWLWLPGDAAPSSYPLPGQAALTALLAPALDATLHPPQPYPAKFRGGKDPNAADLAALAKPTPVLLPFLADKKLAARLGALPLRLYPDGPLLRFPLEALVVAPAPARNPGAAPIFLGTSHAVTRGLLPGLPPAARASEAAASWAMAGPITPPPEGAGCPPTMVPSLKGLYDPCGGSDAALEAERVRGAFSATPEKLVAFAGADAGPTAPARALAAGTVAHLLTPLDADSGALLTSGGEGAAASPVDAFALGLAESHAARVLLTRLSAPPVANERGLGLLRFAAALRFAGVGNLTILAWRNGADVDAALLASVAAAVAGGTELGGALAGEQAASRAAGAPAVAKPVGLPQWHPWYWARVLDYAP